MSFDHFGKDRRAFHEKQESRSIKKGLRTHGVGGPKKGGAPSQLSAKGSNLPGGSPQTMAMRRRTRAFIKMRAPVLVSLEHDERHGWTEGQILRACTPDEAEEAMHTQDYMIIAEVITGSRGRTARCRCRVDLGILLDDDEPAMTIKRPGPQVIAIAKTGARLVRQTKA